MAWKFNPFTGNFDYYISKQTMLHGIITHNKNINGNDIYAYDDELSEHVYLGALVVIDNNGNVVFN